MSFTWKHAAAMLTAAGMVLPLCAAAQETGTPEQAQAMVKKAAEFLSKEGAEKTVQEAARKDGAFVSGGIYVTITSLDGHTLAHPINSKLAGRHMIDMQDVDGTYLYKERIEKAQTQTSFWHDYKFLNPTTKKIEPKTCYCEKMQDLILCAGAYKR
jgi:cytochrome c